jgi:hypothetical protein
VLGNVQTEQQLRLATGRVLAYDEHGAVDGAPIFYFPGSPSTRLEWHLFGSDALARKLKVRVIVFDRPGLGRSDFQPGRRISDWPADVIALADRLALARFAVLDTRRLRFNPEKFFGKWRIAVADGSSHKLRLEEDNAALDGNPMMSRVDDRLLSPWD